MPATSVVPTAKGTQLYIVQNNGVDREAHVLQRRPGEVYVHYVNSNKTPDEWVSEDVCKPVPLDATPARRNKRKRVSEKVDSPVKSPSPSVPFRGDNTSVQPEITKKELQEDIVMTEEDCDIQRHKQNTTQRNFDIVHFGDWQIKTWYFSPYPIVETETEDVDGIQGSSSVIQDSKTPGIKSKSFGRTSDILTGSIVRQNNGEKSNLWVCEMCFKYMADGQSWELHKKSCNRHRPPGRKVYQRGAHTIWEVDGAREKLYCQNLSLFGKLFIDVKTLFFDCDNFLFYILTDATSTDDHILGFFSKEKVTYDDYNLACIMTLPPYQRKGYGMLMIEFSYELSRRAGKIGTPERPLSDLGLRSYLAYWVSTLLRFFRRVLSVLPPETPKVKTTGNFPDLQHSLNGDLDDGASRRRKRAKGWDGEGTDSSLGLTPLITMDDPMFTTQRQFTTVHKDDGSAETHVSVHCTLGDISRATNLRVEDAAFALNECGLLTKRLPHTTNKDTVVLTRTMVEQIAKERNVKRMCIDLNHVLL